MNHRCALNDKMRWLPALSLYHRNRAHTRACKITLNSAVGARHWESIREGNLHTCVVCCRNKMPVLLLLQAQNKARIWNWNLSSQLLLQMKSNQFILEICLFGQSTPEKAICLHPPRSPLGNKSGAGICWHRPIHCLEPASVLISFGLFSEMVSAWIISVLKYL